MAIQDNRLMPVPSGSGVIDRPLRDLTVPVSAPSSTSASSFAEQVHLRDYLQIVQKRKWLILSIMLIVTTLVALYMYRLPDIYEAKLGLQIEQKTKPLLQSKEFVFGTQNDLQYRNTQLKLLENPKLMRQVALALDLPNNSNFLGGRERDNLLTTVRRAFGGDKKTETTPQGLAVATDDESTTANITASDTLTSEQLAKLEPYEDALGSSLIVEPTEKTNLVELKFRHTDPQLAQAVVTTIAQTFINNDVQRETSGTQTQAGSLARQITDLQLQTRQLEEQRIAYLKNNDLPLGAAEGQDLTATRLKSLSTYALDAEKEMKDAQAAYDSARRATDAFSIPEVQQNLQVQRVRQKVNDLEEKRSALLVQYTKEYPEVQKVDEQISQSKRDLRKLSDEVVNSLRLKYEAATSKESKLRSAYAAERGTANTRSQAEILLSDLNQRLETTKELYNTATKRQKELDITSGERSNNVTVATDARLPRAPVAPARTRNIAIALLLSLMAGVGLSVLLDSLDDSLKSIEEVERYINLPTLALIPAPRLDKLIKARAGKSTALTTMARDANALTLIEDVRSPVAEAYRHLRTSLLLSSAGQPPRSVLVTSSQPSEGKTTTAVNTAMMLAQTGVEVLILDCDLRRPRIHAHFGLPNSRGLTNYLAGENTLDDVMHSYERLPNLKVMSSGPVPPNPAELLGSDEMRRLIHTLQTRFTHIIIDSPPTISFTDAAILSTLTDGVMLVVHGGRSSRSIVRRARQQLLDVGAHIYGIVLNNVKLESSDYNYYAGYYANYYDNTANDEQQDAKEKARV
ncbi:MAG: polysaccharide biosynthesis tyrosine autokinase [Pyrinomonadaceae bacterium MAG19_C2-C3]|nr:polysaccharide biosynthesis tyrosine autokinase [Pyrinomonadaceae bacterium MAG19_C2-C3]